MRRGYRPPRPPPEGAGPGPVDAPHRVEKLPPGGLAFAAMHTPSRPLRWLGGLVAAALAAATLVTATPASADPPVLTECTVTVTPATFGLDDTVALSVTSSDTSVLAYTGFDGTILDAAGDAVPFDYEYPGIFLYAALGAGTHTIEMYAADDATVAPVCSADFTILGPEAPFFLTDATLPPGTVGAPYSQTITADPGAPLFFAVEKCEITGTLPPGLTLASGPKLENVINCGTITGTPTTPGTYTFTGTITYTETVIPVSGSVPSQVEPEVLTVERTFTLVVPGDAVAPAFTG